MAIFEQPFMIVVFGLVVIAACLMFWVGTRSRVAAICVLSAIFGTLGLLVIERLVVTSAEQVKHTVRSVAQALETNDPAQVRPFIAASSRSLADEMDRTLKMAHVNSISVKSNLTAKVARGGTSAVARFNAVASVAPKQGDAHELILPKLVVLQLRREADAWHIVSYELHDPRGEEAGNGMQSRLQKKLGIGQ